MSTNVASLDLRRLLETLPQELYDEIYNLTFTANSKVVDLDFYYATVAKGKRTLGTVSKRCDSSTRFHGRDSINLFLVDRASSKRFARTYFGGIFLLRDIEVAITFLNNLAPDHRAMLVDIRVLEDAKLDGILHEIVLEELRLGDLGDLITVHHTVKGLGLAGMVKTDENGESYHADGTLCIGCTECSLDDEGEDQVENGKKGERGSEEEGTKEVHTRKVIAAWG